MNNKLQKNVAIASIFVLVISANSLTDFAKAADQKLVVEQLAKNSNKSNDDDILPPKLRR